MPEATDGLVDGRLQVRNDPELLPINKHGPQDVEPDSDSEHGLDRVVVDVVGDPVTLLLLDGDQPRDERPPLFFDPPAVGNIPGDRKDSRVPTHLDADLRHRERQRPPAPSLDAGSAAMRAGPT